MATVIRAVLSSRRREGRDEDRTGMSSALLPVLQKCFVALSVLKGKCGGEDVFDKEFTVILLPSVSAHALRLTM